VALGLPGPKYQGYTVNLHIPGWRARNAQLGAAPGTQKKRILCRARLTDEVASRLSFSSLVAICSLILISKITRIIHGRYIELYQ